MRLIFAFFPKQNILFIFQRGIRIWLFCLRVILILFDFSQGPFFENKMGPFDFKGFIIWNHAKTFFMRFSVRLNLFPPPLLRDPIFPSFFCSREMEKKRQNIVPKWVTVITLHLRSTTQCFFLLLRVFLTAMMWPKLSYLWLAENGGRSGGRREKVPWQWLKQSLLWFFFVCLIFCALNPPWILCL